MKKTLLIGMAIGVVSMIAASAFAVTGVNDLTYSDGTPKGRGNRGGAGIVGSSHDLSGNASASSYFGPGQADKQSRICVFCHHPHNTYKAAGTATGNETGAELARVSTLAYSPLWNRESTTTNFIGYNNGIMKNSSPTLQDNVQSTSRHALNAVNAGGTQLSGVSLLCMSCHDGSVALNAYSQNTGSAEGAGTADAFLNTGRALFSADSKMTNHHPMGFNYEKVSQLDKEIKAPTSQMTTTQTIGDLLYGPNKTMECVTCHDVHNSGNEKDAERFLWKSNDRSAFCLACHDK